jgi:hypothetical protein
MVIDEFSKCSDEHCKLSLITRIKKINNLRNEHNFIKRFYTIVDIRVNMSTCCGLTAFNVVGRLANIIRLVMAIGLAASAILVFLIASGILATVLPIILYVSAGLQICATVTIVFDLSTAKWLIEKVLTTLTQDIYKLEAAVSELNSNVDKLEKINDDLEVSVRRADVQIHERELQIRKAELQIDQFTMELVDMKSIKTQLQATVEKQHAQLENNAMISANMQQLLSSMLSAQASGEDMNAHFSLQIGRLERAISLLQTVSFDVIDIDNDGVITKAEFEKIIG